jgi:hypothetical protein
MASPFQQRSLRRKFIYFGLIVVLLTVSGLHRKLVIGAQARKLRLREEDYGKVALTDTALKLGLAGMRGLAVTSLWLTAIERMKRHEWSELESAVQSLTKLQPHYISPWLFQSWNLAFNVSVECDRSRDKYFYITRGIELLAEGERRNSGNKDPDPDLRSPGNPEMRHYVGFYYQLKIGQGDEKRTLRCLFDLSCIDPKERNPARLGLWAYGAEGKEVNREKFKDFCLAHPRLVRRLREQLGMSRPEEVVLFLEANYDLPGRFRKEADNEGLLPAAEQFPVLPPVESRPDWGPDPAKAAAGWDEVDVFLITRLWYEFAQEPLPPPNGKRGFENEPKAIPGRHRLPKMEPYIFRTYPARAQAYSAEERENEGWFDGKNWYGYNPHTGKAEWREGWSINEAFEGLPKRLVRVRGVEEKDDYVAGVGKFLATDAWKVAARLYRDYGEANALPDPKEWARLQQLIQAAGPNTKEAREGLWLASTLQLVNYHPLLLHAEAEQFDQTAAGRKRFYRAELLDQQQLKRQAIPAFEEAMDRWIDVLLEFPEFARQTHVQEDIYDKELRYLYLLQDQNKDDLEFTVFQSNLLTQGASCASPACWPPSLTPLGVLPIIWKQTPKRLISMRNVQGPLDRVFVYRGTGQGLGESRIRWDIEQSSLEGTVEAVARSEAFLASVPPVGPGALAGPALLGKWLADPQLKGKWVAKREMFGKPLTAQERRRLLLRVQEREAPRPPGWEPLIEDSTIQLVRGRRGWDPPPRPDMPRPNMPGGPPGGMRPGQVPPGGAPQRPPGP